MSNNVLLITGSYDHSFIFWDPISGQPQSTIDYGEKHIANRIEISLDKKYLAAAVSQSAVFYDLVSMKSTPLHVYDNYTNNVTAIGFQKDSMFMYTCSEDGSIKLHDIRQNTTPRSYQEKVANNTVGLHPNEVELIVGDQNGTIKSYDLQQDKLKYSYNLDVAVRALSIAQNASQFVAADSHGTCHQFTLPNSDFGESSEYTKFEAHSDYILQTKLSPDLRYLATCSADKTIKLWKNQEGKWALDKSLYGNPDSLHPLRALQVGLGLRLQLRLRVRDHRRLRQHRQDLANRNWRCTPQPQGSQASNQLSFPQRHCS